MGASLIWLCGWVPGLLTGAGVVLYFTEEVRIKFHRRSFTFSLLIPTPTWKEEFRFIHHVDSTLTFSHWHAYQIFFKSNKVWEVVIQWKKRDRTFD